MLCLYIVLVVLLGWKLEPELGRGRGRERELELELGCELGRRELEGLEVTWERELG